MPIKQTTIPKGWKEVKFGDVVLDMKDGGTPSRRKDEYFNGNIPWVVVKDIKPKIFNTATNISDLGLQKSSAKLWPAGSVILSFGATIGEIGIAEVPLTTKQGIAGIVPNMNKITKEYLYFYLTSQKERLNQLASGSTIKEVRPNTVKKHLIVSLPPLSEQKKIAEILSTVDEDIEKTEEVIEKTEELKKGLMRKLLSGNWKTVKMKDICTVRQGLQIAIKNRFKEPGKNRYIYITIKYLKKLDDTDYIENPSKRVICNKNDVLMTRTGNTGIVVTDVDGVFHNNFFLVDFNRNLVDKDYFVYYLRSKKIQDIILDRAGITTISDLNHGDFYSIPFLIPPMKEQKRIAEILLAVDKKIEINKKLKNKLTELKKGLMQDLLSGKVRVKV